MVCVWPGQLYPLRHYPGLSRRVHIGLVTRSSKCHNLGSPTFPWFQMTPKWSHSGCGVGVPGAGWSKQDDMGVTLFCHCNAHSWEPRGHWLDNIPLKLIHPTSHLSEPKRPVPSQHRSQGLKDWPGEPTDQTRSNSWAPTFTHCSTSPERPRMREWQLFAQGKKWNMGEKTNRNKPALVTQNTQTGFQVRGKN